MLLGLIIIILIIFQIYIKLPSKWFKLTTYNGWHGFVGSLLGSSIGLIGTVLIVASSNKNVTNQLNDNDSWHYQVYVDSLLNSNREAIKRCCSNLNKISSSLFHIKHKIDSLAANILVNNNNKLVSQIALLVFPCIEFKKRIDNDESFIETLYKYRRFLNKRINSQLSYRIDKSVLNNFDAIDKDLDKIISISEKLMDEENNGTNITNDEILLKMKDISQTLFVASKINDIYVNIINSISI